MFRIGVSRLMKLWTQLRSNSPIPKPWIQISNIFTHTNKFKPSQVF